MILETERLTLRPLQSTDVEAVASYSMKPEFIRFLPLPPNDGKRSPIRRTGGCQRSARSQGRLALCHPDQGRAKAPRHHTHRRPLGGTSTRDLGYAVHPDHWG